ncbi:MAG: DUF721 domain-containing protein [Gammaproteobacteria bacterium]|nr:DUF721 domain-containing protein [Gammaproteobacteria bacterium]
MNSPRQLYKFLSRKKGDVADLITHTLEISKLNKHLQRLVDEPLRSHITLSNLKGETAILIADTPVWASRLRYIEPMLLQKISNNIHLFGNIHKIEIRVAPIRATLQPSEPEPRKISENAAQCLHNMAESVEDIDLKEALERLAQHGKK